LHELCTNAAKYGALSNDRGRLSVTWTRCDDQPKPAFEVRWEESGGPPVAEPDRMGFGSNIIRASVERQLRGKVRKEWLPDGLRCTLTIPAAEVAAVLED